MNTSMSRILFLLFFVQNIYSKEFQIASFNYSLKNTKTLLAAYFGALCSIPCAVYLYKLGKKYVRRRSFSNMLPNQIIEYAEKMYRETHAPFAQEIALIDQVDRTCFDQNLADLIPSLRKDYSLIAQTMIEQIYQKCEQPNPLWNYIKKIDAALQLIYECKTILHDREIFLLYRKKNQNEIMSKAINETVQQFSIQQLLLQTLSEQLLIIRAIVMKHSAYKIELLITKKMSRPFLLPLWEKINNPAINYSSKTSSSKNASLRNGEFLKTVAMALNDSAFNNSLRTLTHLV